jgi:hypothetical protein
VKLQNIKKIIRNIFNNQPPQQVLLEVYFYFLLCSCVWGNFCTLTPVESNLFNTLLAKISNAYAIFVELIAETYTN